MEWGNISVFLAVHKRTRPQSRGFEKGSLDVSASFTFPSTQHIFVCGALKPAEHSLPAGDKALPKLLLWTVETAFPRKASSSSTKGTTAKLRQPWQVELLVGSNF